jgi:hypothetical protein
VTTDFKEGSGGDILDLHNLLLGFGTDAVVLVDANGGSNGFITLVELFGVSLDLTETMNLRLWLAAPHSSAVPFGVCEEQILHEPYTALR